ncbi:WD repeat-containing protein GTS1-like isoform X2 [Primulina huaijiensis]|uniref:WD repeat-containing protein GTS1-like isoform X2 n=1 Tax=Primulina huaijiensis TaxID=1492673 RepID=UPI003CC72825
MFYLYFCSEDPNFYFGFAIWVSCISTGPSQEIFSFSFAGSGANILDAGCKSQLLSFSDISKRFGNSDMLLFQLIQQSMLFTSHDWEQIQIIFWDWRTMTQTACLEESHMMMLPRLMCLFDTNGNIKDDDHLVSIGGSIKKPLLQSSSL